MGNEKYHHKNSQGGEERQNVENLHTKFKGGRKIKQYKSGRNIKTKIQRENPKKFRENTIHGKGSKTESEKSDQITKQNKTN